MKKIDKRACRKFCVEPLRINPNNGLLHADAINYIVRATVRAIGGKRLLVLSFFPTKGTFDAVRNPKYVVFQGKDDFITLEYCNEGKTKWRRGNIMWLDCEPGNMKDKSAFYSQKDEKKAIRFCNPGHFNGLMALSRLQSHIAELRARATVKKRQLEIVKIMKPVDRRRLPKGLLPWAERELIPAHIFYNYRKGKTIHSGYCSRCKAHVQVENPRHNKDGVCPNCQAQVTFHAIGRHNTVHERETVQVIQHVGDALVSRIIKVYFTYRNSPEASVTVWECSRMFFTTDNGKYQMTEYYWTYTNRAITHWIKGPRPQFSRYHYYFNADTCAYVYLDNLRKELKDTPWQYSQLKEFCENTEGGMYLPNYLKKYYEAPAMEYIVKLRLYMLAINAAYGNRENCTDHRDPLNLKGNGLREVLGIGKEYLPMLQVVNPNTHTLYVLQELLRAGVLVSAELLKWCQEHKVYEPDNIARCLKYTSVGKLMSYILSQVSHVKYA